MTNAISPKIPGLVLKTPDEAFIQGGFVTGIYGQSGRGKTTFIGSIAKSKYAGNVLWVDCKGAAYVIAGQKFLNQIKILEPLTFSTLDNLNTNLLKTPGKFTGTLPNGETEVYEYGSIVFDHLTHMQHMHLIFMSAANSREWKHYTRSQEWIQDKLVDPWVDVAKRYGINVTFVFQPEIDKDEEGKRWVNRMDLTPHVAMQLPYYFDYIGYLDIVKEGSDERVLSFAPSPKFVTKTRRPLAGAGADIPKVIYHPDLGHILDVLKGGVKWETHHNTPRTRGSVSESAQEAQQEEKEENG